MSATKVVIIDYGVGNLLSVRRGLERCGATVEITSDPQAILGAPRVVLPGVGAFADGMAELRRRKLDVVVQKVASQGTPLLGICLGMQMLLDASEEFGVTDGLGLIPGRVVPIQSGRYNGDCGKIPHIGWDGLVPPPGRSNWVGTLLEGIQPGEAVYLVHSFMAALSDQRNNIANCVYGQLLVPTAIGRENVVGCQFHPEKSGEVGLRILHRFVMK